VSNETKDCLRYNAGKPQLSYLLSFPDAIKAIAKVCMYGETKYARGNYLSGAPWTHYIDSLLRHLTDFAAGVDDDPESGQSHMAHVAWNALMLSQMFETRKDKDDRIFPPPPATITHTEPSDLRPGEWNIVPSEDYGVNHWPSSGEILRG